MYSDNSSSDDSSSDSLDSDSDSMDCVTDVVVRPRMLILKRKRVIPEKTSYVFENKKDAQNFEKVILAEISSE